MRELSDVMADAVAARARSLSGLTPSETRLTAVKSLVRRRRASRRTLQAIAVVSVVAVVLTGAWFGLGHRDGPAPAITPTPTATPSPSQSPLGDPVTEPGFPPYYPMPDGLLQETGPGWVLATYMPWLRSTANSREQRVPRDEAVFLVSPDGTNYLVLRLNPVELTPWGLTPAVLGLRSWRAGATTAVIQQSPLVEHSEPGSLLTIDLLTGALRPFNGDLEPDRGELLGFRSEPVPSPDARFAFTFDGEVIDTETGALVGSFADAMTSGRCNPVSWWTPDSLLALCHDAYETSDASPGPSLLELHARLVSFNTEQLVLGQGTVVHELEPGDPIPFADGGAWVADGTIVVQGVMLTEESPVEFDACADGAYLFRGESFQRLAASDAYPGRRNNIFESQVSGGRVYVEASRGCSSELGPTTVASFDIETGETVQLLGPPSDDPDTFDTYFVQGLTTYIIAE